MGFLRFLAFALVRAGQGFWRNKMMSLAATATVILMLVLLSGLVIVLGGLQAGLAYIEQQGGGHRAPGRRPDARPTSTPSSPTSRDLRAWHRSPTSLPRRPCIGWKEAYAERGQELDTGGAQITLYASIEIYLTDPIMGDSVAARPIRDGPRSSGSRPARSSTTSCWASSSSAWRDIAAMVLVGLTVVFMIVNTIRIAVFCAQPARSRSCAWWAPATRSSAGRSSSRACCAACWERWSPSPGGPRVGPGPAAPDRDLPDADRGGRPVPTPSSRPSS